MDITTTNKVLMDNRHQIFIESGGPDAYLGISNDFIDESGIFNETSLINASLSSISTPTLNETSLNVTHLTDEPVSEVILMAVLSLVLGLMILVTVIGNVFVIAAIILERNLQNVANYLVASLAVADLLVACLVMPLGAVYEISKGWILGPELCDMWTSFDVLCCTASILHLVAIATDRYWAVTNVDYIHSRTSKRVFIMIFLVWFFAVIVSLAPQFGWKDPEYMQRIEQLKCMVSQDVSYQVFATCCTFYVPLFVILVLYWKIYQTARKRIRRRKPKLPIASNNNQDVPKPKRKLRFRIGAFSSHNNNSDPDKSKKGATAHASSLGLVEGNSTNTVNTVEDVDQDNSTNNASNGSDSMPAKQIHFHHGGSGKNKPCTSSTNGGTEVTAFNTNVVDESATSSSSTTTTTITTSSVNQITQAPSAIVIENNNQHLQPPLSTPPPSAGSDSGNNQLPIATISSQVSTPLHHTPQAASNANKAISNLNKRKETIEAKRERKAAKTLAIITGAFVVCWLPFFLMALLMPLCETCEIQDWIASLFLWLGYFNSTLNPVIYTIFSPEFRQAFKRILFGSHNRATYYRRGKL
ncbi:5-hydroxytryptamine receptor [Culicoides brevitarsis]|uniref:5-hydroxytryptamine receptor n=1 Tax=Culicoides brevitarsis TaxID=469753 RepID=UPI00307CB52E